jgi:hypothetical protein
VVKTFVLIFGVLLAPNLWADLSAVSCDGASVCREQSTGRAPLVLPRSFSHLYTGPELEQVVQENIPAFQPLFALAGELPPDGEGDLLGESSYGKCLTQTLAPLDDGGAVRFSNGRLWGPAGTPCREQGLEPDLPVAGVETKAARVLLEEASGMLTSGPAEPSLSQ